MSDEDFITGENMFSVSSACSILGIDYSKLEALREEDKPAECRSAVSKAFRLHCRNNLSTVRELNGLNNAGLSSFVATLKFYAYRINFKFVVCVQNLRVVTK